jgi:hypothetical protein
MNWNMSITNYMKNTQKIYKCKAVYSEINMYSLEQMITVSNK